MDGIADFVTMNDTMIIAHNVRCRIEVIQGFNLLLYFSLLSSAIYATRSGGTVVLVGMGPAIVKV